MAGALEGIHVLDISDGMAGGYCTKLLAALAAAGTDHRAKGQTARVGRDERFGKQREPSTAMRSVGNEVTELLERALDVERNRCRLHGGDSVRTSPGKVCAQRGESDSSPITILGLVDPVALWCTLNIK